MFIKTIAPALLLVFSACAQPPLPELRTEPTDGGSIFRIRNTGTQPLTAFLIELVNYPGSSYSLWQDEIASEPIAPGGEKRIRVANMTVGAVPDYVKLQAAIYADGTSSGIPEKVAQFIERRRFTLETTRELIRRLEKGQAKAALIADLKQWSDSLPPQGKVNRNSQAAINQAAARALIADTVARLDAHSQDEILASLRASERALATSKPALSLAQGQNPDAHYQLGPDSLAQDGVPKGEIRGPFTLPSEVFPGTSHTYWVYVPAQYRPSSPASLMVFNDGQAYMAPEGDVRAQNVLDNLIYRWEIPVMIAVFINPGRRPDQPEPTPRDWGDRNTNRPVEYNSLDDRYPRVIVDELLPVLYKDYNISKDPDQHGIGGASSGAIAAFTVAWERPNDFHKVLSIVGSFVNLRGGNVYPEIIRKSQKKPIRIFLQDGRNDNRGTGSNGVYDETRDWFLQNVRLMKALTEKGYEVNYAWGMNRHGQKMGGAILPEMMRWLWRDHPADVDPTNAVERSFNEPTTDKTDVEYARPSGKALLLDLHVPSGTGPFPAAILVHGGGFDEGSKSTNVRPLFDVLANAGFAWFSIDYRLAPEVRFPQAIEDLYSAIRWVKANATAYRVDVSKIAIIGESAGGYLVNYAGTHETPDTKVDAVVDFYGPADYGNLSELRREHPERFNMATINRHASNGGGIHYFGVERLDSDGLAKLREFSPIAAVHGGMPPFLCIHGTKDDQVPYEQSPAMCEAMHKAGASCELIAIEGGGHGMNGWRAPEFQHWKPEMIVWLKKTLTVK